MASLRILSVKESTTLAILNKALEMKAKGEDVIILSAGEPDLDTPQDVKDAGIKAIKKGFTRYTESSGIFPLREAIAEKLRRENSIYYKPSQILISCGAKNAIFNILFVLLAKGDEAIIFSPYWTSYPEMVKLTGAKPVIVDTTKFDFEIPLNELNKCLTKNTRLIILNSPCNPTGIVYSKKQLHGLAKFVVDNGLYIISDEVYEKMVYDNLIFVSVASLSNKVKKRTIVINGVSKSYAMTGWRIGYAAGEEEIIRAAGRVQMQTISCACSISQYAALAALKGSQDFIKNTIVEYQRRRDLLYEELSQISDLRVVKPQGAFYLFPKVSHFFKKGIKNSETFCRKFFDTYKVAIVPGSAFGADEYVRISFAADIESIIEGVKRFKKFIDSLR
jgi:aspartate aminotransferase